VKPSIDSELRDLRLALYALEFSNPTPARRAAELRAIQAGLAELRATGKRTTMLPSEIAVCRAVRPKRNGLEFASIPGATVL